MITLRIVLTFLLFSIAATQSQASDAYLVRFKTSGKSANCAHASWQSDTYFLNQGSIPAVVRLLGVSNAELPLGSVYTLTLPPGQLVALSDPRTPEWRPAGQSDIENFFVLHLDIPADVVVESRDQALVINDCLIQPGPTIIKVSLPIFRALVPANKVQTFLGTDAGSTPAHQNVAVYNAGAQQATAHVEIHQGCRGELIDQRTVTIPANTILQVNGLTTVTSSACFDPFVPSQSRYTVVTVDQPSLVLVTTITDPQPGSGLIPRVEMAIANSSQF